MGDEVLVAYGHRYAPDQFEDAGADRVLDFTDYGHPSTYRVPLDELRDLVSSLRDDLSEGDPDVVVIEVADGIYQTQTGGMIADPEFAHSMDCA